MKSTEQIAQELNKLIEAHYYSEDFELLSSIRAFADSMCEGDKDTLAGIVMKRLMDEGSIVDILLCSVLSIPSAVSILAGRLSNENVPNQITRALISALRKYKNDTAYTAVERFVDSEQEMEALQALAEIDFVRTLPLMSRLMQKEHYHGIVLHILHLRMKEVGIDQLIRDITLTSISTSTSFKDSLVKSLNSKKEPYNPFRESEILRIIKAVRPA
ncbi:MAG TPA: hypothetical protein PJ991_04075 [Kiritimatiellia bacterium]|nr:hypothetical protein [Kiritimatiellia bacterium]